ncbi:MAG TPA: replicative DNA helicase [Oscillospiraceae bacterium]|nr:replicative DNA helicase [Oscillospiraceae bacterium]
MDDLLGRQMPHSLEAEQAALGSMLLDSRCVPQVVEALRPDEFYLRQNREIFETLCHMFTHAMRIDPVTLLEQLQVSGVYDEKTTRDYVFQLLDITPTAANVMSYVEIIKGKAVLRSLEEAADDIVTMIREGGGTPADVLEAAERRVYAIRQGRNTQGLEHISKVIQEVYLRLGELQSRGNRIPGLSTGIGRLDATIAGLNKSDLVLLASRPGMGKTSFALNMALSVAKSVPDRAVVFFSLEMSREQLGMRLLATEGLVNNKSLITGALSPADWEKIAVAAAVLNRTGLLIDDNPSLTVADMNAKCRRVENLSLVIVDYLQLMQSAGTRQNGSESRQQIVSDISRSLKIMAKELQVPVLCLSQLSRAGEREGVMARKPRLSDLRESGAIEQDADIVMFLYREDYYSEDADNPNLAECIVAKNRHGETGTLPLQWQPDYTLFTDVETRYEED